MPSFAATAVRTPPLLPPPPPILRGTRTWTLWTSDGATDVEVEADDTATVGEVLSALTDALGCAAASLWAGSTPLAAETELAAGPLRHGAVLGLGRPGPRTAAGSAEGSGALELQVVGGPDAGRVLPLVQGELVVGRGATSGLPLTDPDVSRRHVLVNVGSGRLTVTDLASSNGTHLRTPTGPVSLGDRAIPWSAGSTLLLGASAIRLSGPRGAPLECSAAPQGRLRVRPVPSRPTPATEVVIRTPTPPPEVSRRRLGWVAVVLPAVGGALLAWLLAAPQFLFFALLGPVVAVGSWASDRASGRRLRRRTTADHAAALARYDHELAVAVGTAAAVLDDIHPDLAALATAVRRRCSPLWSRTRTSPDLLVVRLGRGRGTTGVTRVDAQGVRTPVSTDDLPVTADLGLLGSLGLVGPRARSMGLARALVLQLIVLAPPGELRVVVLTAAGDQDDWRWTRWSPAVTVISNPDGLPDDLLGGPDLGARTVVVLDGPVGAQIAAAVVAAPPPVCLALGSSVSALAVPTAACLTVSGETGARGRLQLPGVAEERNVALDSVPESVAAATARSLSGLAAPASSAGIPDTATLADLPQAGLRPDPGTGDLSGRWDRGRATLECSLGVTEQGPLAVDLCAQGPHLLVAGTTGAGKSELLQTLVTGLALHHPPDRVSFLLVDYKGGAAFAEAAELPHTVGMLTDLDPQSTVRALRSLSAELTRRERLLAELGARDVAELPPEVPLGRLVIVVDEFATLVDELPGFVAGLIGIAQRGRSLGVHLVLATQRPSGVVSLEIRANCSLRICLRTTDESDSRDVLGTPLAAAIPAGRPGRAYVRCGSAAPLLMQVARVAGMTGRARGGVRVRACPWPPESTTAGPDTAARQRPGDLAILVQALRERAEQAGLTPAGRPWLPPLPAQLPAARLDAAAAAGAAATQLRIGLLDSPDTQMQQPLTLDLADGGGWLAAGGPRSGRTTTLRTVLREAVHQLTPAGLHVHVLDHGGGGLATEAGGLPHTGTAVAGDDAHRTVRLLARLQAEVDRRRRTASPGAPALLLLVDGYEALAAQLDDAEPGTGSAAFLRLVRDGAAAGLTCVVTAERAVPGSRLAASMRTRLVLPLPDRADYAVAGIGPRDVPGFRPPGRALVGEETIECQLAQPRPVTLMPSEPGQPGGPAGPTPIRVLPLPPDPALSLPDPTSDAAAGALALPIGPGDDEGRAVTVDLVRTGGLLVVGPPGSGRSSALAAFAAHCRAAGAAVLCLGAGGPEDGAGDRPDQPGPPDHLDRGDAAGLRAWATGTTDRPAVVVADDVGTLPDPVADTLGALARPGGPLLVLAAASAPELAGAFRGPTVALRRSRTALLLGPAPGDAELLGLRVPRTPLPARPGAGWLVVGRDVTRVQVARRRTSPRPTVRRP